MPPRKYGYLIIKIDYKFLKVGMKGNTNYKLYFLFSFSYSRKTHIKLN